MIIKWFRRNRTHLGPLGETSFVVIATNWAEIIRGVVMMKDVVGVGVVFGVGIVFGVVAITIIIGNVIIAIIVDNIIDTILIEENEMAR